MGQQQLLLLVLGIVIVGLATAYGITMFDLNHTKSNADVMINEAFRMATDIQSWAVKPSMFGGVASSETLADVTFNDIGYPNSSGTYNSPNGDFVLSNSLGSGCDTPVIPSGNSVLIYINGTNDDTGNSICVAIAGTEVSDIGTDAKYGSGISS